jgi:hypothetical protein
LQWAIFFKSQIPIGALFRSARNLFEPFYVKETSMGKTNSNFLIPAILAVIALCVACICCAAIALYFYGDQLVTRIRNPSGTSPTEIPPAQLPDNTPEWTIIVFSAADDEVLEETMWFDVNEMELVGSSPQLNIVVQIDRYGGYLPVMEIGQTHADISLRRIMT